MSENTSNNELTEELEEEIDDPVVMQVPIDDTLSISGEAADAKAVGDALALKADKSELTTQVTVNGKSADAQGNIALLAEDIPMSSGENAATVAGMIQTLTDGMGDIEGAMEEVRSETVRSVNGEKADEHGNVQITEVPFAKQLTSNVAQGKSGEFLFRPTAGHTPVGDGAARLVSILGRRIHTGETEQSRGTITTAAPSAFRATGWNLYNHTAGYARVVRYSDEYGYMIAGTYTAVQFSETLEGEKTTITPDSGAFDLPDGADEGYVWVTGGNSTDTAVYMTWSDWTEGYDGEFAVYVEYAISLSSVMSSYFPYGLGQVGGVCDEIAINAGQAIRRINRMAYSAANLAAAEASGRDYECDTNYIYIVMETPEISAITISGGFTANDHGTEIIDGSTVPVCVQAIYGQNLVDKLRTDVVTISEQTLTALQQAQVLENIGASPVLKPAPNKQWAAYPGKPGTYLYHYEGESQTTTYFVPCNYCEVITIWYSSQRGVAIAVSWHQSSYPGHIWTCSFFNAIWCDWQRVLTGSNIVCETYSTTTGSSSPYAWSISESKSGYIPIGYSVRHANSGSVTAGAESYTRANGSITVAGYASAGGKTVYVDVTWMRV